MSNMDFLDIYEERLLIFIEHEGVFNQVLVNDKQFKKISDILFKPEESNENLKDGYECGSINIGEQEVSENVFMGMTSICQ